MSPRKGSTTGLRERGRPTTITPARCVRIIRLVAEGNFFKTASLAAGVPYSTAQGWKAQGEVALERLRVTRPDVELEVGDWLDSRVAYAEDDETAPPVHEWPIWTDTPPEWIGAEDDWWTSIVFQALLLRAKAQSEALHIRAIGKAASAGEWRASAWYLERVHPESYAPRDPAAPVRVEGVDESDLGSRIDQLVAQRRQLEAKSR